MSPAYCGDACRAQTSYDPSNRLTVGFLSRRVRPSERATWLRSARFIRADRVRLARLGACIGCGTTARERDAAKWSEYDSAAEWCAERGLRGKVGDALPNLLGSDVCEEINADPDAFEERVRAFAYARAMRSIDAPAPILPSLVEPTERRLNPVRA